MSKVYVINEDHLEHIYEADSSEHSDFEPDGEWVFESFDDAKEEAINKISEEIDERNKQINKIRKMKTAAKYD